MLKDNNQIIVPADEYGYPKTFVFSMDTKRLKKLSVSQDFQNDLFEELFFGLHLNEFFIQVFPTGYEFFLSSAVFELSGTSYNFNYVNDFYPDNYGWMEDPFIFLEDKFGRIETDIYKFDDYLYKFGMDKYNLDYTLQGEKSEGGWYGQYVMQDDVGRVKK